MLYSPSPKSTIGIPGCQHALRQEPPVQTDTIEEHFGFDPMLSISISVEHNAETATNPLPLFPNTSSVSESVSESPASPRAAARDWNCPLCTPETAHICPSFGGAPLRCEGCNKILESHSGYSTTQYGICELCLLEALSDDDILYEAVLDTSRAYKAARDGGVA